MSVSKSCLQVGGHWQKLELEGNALLQVYFPRTRVNEYLSVFQLRYLQPPYDHAQSLRLWWWWWFQPYDTAFLMARIKRGKVDEIPMSAWQRFRWWAIWGLTGGTQHFKNDPVSHSSPHLTPREGGPKYHQCCCCICYSLLFRIHAFGQFTEKLWGMLGPENSKPALVPPSLH